MRWKKKQVKNVCYIPGEDRILKALSLQNVHRKKWLLIPPTAWIPTSKFSMLCLLWGIKKEKENYILSPGFISQSFFKAMCVFESLCLHLYISRQSQNSLEIEPRRLLPPTLTFTMQHCEEAWLSSLFALPQLSQRLTVKGQSLCSLVLYHIRMFWIIESQLMSKHCLWQRK